MMLKNFFLVGCIISTYSTTPMEQLENKTWWTVDELRSYCALKNNLAARRWCHRKGIMIRHGMVSKNEIFNCLAGTANVPPLSLYKRITKTNEPTKQGDNNGHYAHGAWNPQSGIRKEPQPDLGNKPALLYGRAAKRLHAAGRLGRHHHAVSLPEAVGGGRVDCAV